MLKKKILLWLDLKHIESWIYGCSHVRRVFNYGLSLKRKVRKLPGMGEDASRGILTCT